MINIGNNNISKVMLGSLQILKGYLGTTLIYSYTSVTGYTLTIVINGLPSDYEVAKSDIVWALNKNNFNINDTLLDVTPTSDGYVFSPASVPSVFMDQDRTLTFTASVPSSGDLVAGNSRTTLPSQFELTGTNEYTVDSMFGNLLPLNLQMTGSNSIWGFVATDDVATLEIYLAKDNDIAGGTFKRGLYINGGNTVKSEYYDGSWHVGGDIETIVPGVFYGMRNNAGVVSIVKSTDFSSYTTLHTFGADTGYSYLGYYADNTTKLQSPQGLGIITI